MTSLIFNITTQPSAGTISITTDRTTSMCAPDRVRFTVDLSSATFNNTSTYDAVSTVTYSNGYEPNYHNLIYLWDLGDTDTWDIITNGPHASASKRYTKGPVVQHVYADPGTYTVRVLVIEPSSGKVASATTSITVVDADTIFPGTQTICVNPVGDSDFTGAPSGAVQYNLDDLFRGSSSGTAEWIAQEGGLQKRWLFKAGHDLPFIIKLRSNASARYFGAYGTGAKPVLNFRLGSHFQFDGMQGELRITGVQIKGDYDPTSDPVSTSSSAATSFWYGMENNSTDIYDLTLHDVEFRNILGACINMPINNTQAGNFKYAFNELDITDSGGEYNIITGFSASTDSCTSVTGSRIYSNVNQPSNETALRANIRLNGGKYQYIAFNDLFNLSENNPNIKMSESPAGAPHSTNVYANACEGTFGNINLSGPGGGGGGVSLHNTIVDSNICAGTWGTQWTFRTYSTGGTIRNNLVWQPNLATTNGVGLRGLVANETGSTTPPDAPLRVYNNTLVNDRTSANNESITDLPIFTSPTNEYDTVGVLEEENNVVHLPNLNTPVTTFAPLSDATILTPRNTAGRLTSHGGTPDATRATSGTMKDYKPDIGSAAIAAAVSGLRAVYDADVDIAAAFATFDAYTSPGYRDDKGAWSA